MLSEETTQLLTAFVDGELGPRPQEAVRRLLKQSAEARDLVRQLQENARKLKELPERKLDPGFVGDVLRIIQDNKAPSRHASKPRGRRWQPIFAASAAAAVLFVVAGFAFYFATLTDPALPTPLAQQPAVTPKKTERPPVEAPQKPNPLIANVVEGTFAMWAAPIPPDRTVTIAFSDLAKSDQAAVPLTAELKKSSAVDFDLKVANNARALERLKAVFQEHGIKLLIDPSSAEVLKKSSSRAEFWVYAENLKADEITKVLKQLNAGEGQAGPFEKLAVAALPAHEQSHVIALLGIDPASTLGSNQGQLNQGNLAKTPRPTARERVAIVLPQSPAARSSEEVRQFLYQPNRPLPGTLRVLVKIHQE